ncbi:hypothetical protein BLNAU_18129 [Blattamonas nauphoetae]|uniref:DDE-1 domain-containing protein n=1 Tax=Blattamonas nauphoetae TaxID=2049346 RepID=A0ABQ9X5B2_9EUKA|nr:hypothetical protein BLNAU_18129 [Blattamonas nauphoetae]
MSWLAAHQIDVIVLPSHTSEFLQPLDQVVNKEWKKALKSVSMPKDKNDQSQLNQFMNKIDGAVTRALQADYIRKGFEKCGLILRSPTKMLMSLRNVGQTFEEWKQTNTLQKKVDDELNVNSDDGLDCNWKNQIKGDHLDEWESFTVENDNSIPPLKPSASFPISGHVLSDPYFLHRWFEHNAAQKRVEEEREVARRARNERRRAATFRKLEKLQGKQQSTDDFLGKGKLVLQAHSKHRRKFPPVGYRMTRLISYISLLLLIKCFLLKLRMLLSSSRLVLISNVVLALKLGLSLERLSSTAVMQMKILSPDSRIS